MNPSLLVLLLHVGALIQTFRDLEKTVSDVVKGNFQKDDINALLTDINTLVSDGVLVIPGLTTDQMKSAIADIQKAL